MTISGTKQVFLNIIGLHPSESIHRFRYRLTVAIFASIMSAILLLSVWINFLLGVSTDISKTLILLPTATGLATVFCAHWHMLINRNRFYEFLTDMEELARKRSTFNNNRRMYAEAQGSIDILIGRCIKAFIPIYVLHFIPLIIPIYDLLLGTYSIDSWIYFLPLWTPFEINTTLRCIAKELLIFIASTIACLPCWLIACMFIETDIYTKTFVRDIKRIFDRVNRLAWAKYPEHVMLTYCKEAIILHEQVYRCLYRLADVMNWIVLVFVPPLAMSCCTSLYLLSKHFDDATAFQLQYYTFSIFGSLGMLFMLFYFGQRIHSLLSDLSDIIYASEWHLYPRATRRFVQLMMMRAQRPFYLSAYGIFRLSLENYVQVLKWMYSAFALLQNL